MEIAHILVTCEDKREDDIINEMKSIKEVREIKKTFGAYNAVIRVEAESVQKIKRIMADKIRNRPGILSTLTLVSA
ncbi:Lrp/AsnC ligand binding domain-containing protein [Nitrosopumilus sp.]|uniref:Lrp/AsnC ligand binding domain-containing protein n=1 Tax=Nitrosopumilus sp. TaxID=2024843 RepID=UPI00292D159A|nr:Lrp/AsnC ligand binding domain-containing protein [Nitrosopumilus sp.]